MHCLAAQAFVCFSLITCSLQAELQFCRNSHCSGILNTLRHGHVRQNLDWVRSFLPPQSLVSSNPDDAHANFSANFFSRLVTWIERSSCSSQKLWRNWQMLHPHPLELLLSFGMLKTFLCSSSFFSLSLIRPKKGFPKKEINDFPFFSHSLCSPSGALWISQSVPRLSAKILSSNLSLSPSIRLFSDSWKKRFILSRLLRRNPYLMERRPRQ